MGVKAPKIRRRRWLSPGLEVDFFALRTFRVGGWVGGGGGGLKSTQNKRWILWERRRGWLSLGLEVDFLSHELLGWMGKGGVGLKITQNKRWKKGMVESRLGG